eukprot:CAMPEP_0177420546 /NCGR_PEP_ID=MMETSP0368-20130122/70311_1 /TAXON_ID=447022 ORGANISM="Scrippsiella hangoei-like, Strain SHHI-4" /NCGR_SAMPLE_ID=MMETSP0368 /ASSEMBLY_ACC=CAM_ASM_000363 /LENGTH=190 /DNA_ID=CAMNT_0018890341 /DNA_START=1 /DNA_END=571 /DNA_ORIENTATION=-
MRLRLFGNSQRGSDSVLRLLLAIMRLRLFGNSQRGSDSVLRLLLAIMRLRLFGNSCVRSQFHADVKDFRQAAAAIACGEGDAVEDICECLPRGGVVDVVEGLPDGHPVQRAGVDRALLHEALRRPHLRAQSGDLGATHKAAVALQPEVAPPSKERKVLIAAAGPTRTGGNHVIKAPLAHALNFCAGGAEV